MIQLIIASCELASVADERGRSIGFVLRIANEIREH